MAENALESQPDVLRSAVPSAQGEVRPAAGFSSPPLFALAVSALVGILLWLVRWLAPMLSPFLLAFFIVTLSLPGYRALRRRQWNKGLVMAVMVLVLAAVGLGLAALLWVSASRVAVQLATTTGEIEGAVQSLLADVDAQSARTAATTAARAFATVATMTLSVVSQIVISVILSLFLLLEAPRFGRLLHTSMKNLPFLGSAPQVMDTAIQYFLVRLRVNLLVGAMFAIFLWLMGVEHALLWGILTFLLSFVPYVGGLVAALPPLLLALAESGWQWALLVGVGMLLINFGTEYVIAPSMTGKSLNLSPAIVFVSFIFWVWLLGAVGALVAMPLTVLLMLTFRSYDSTRWVAELIGS